NIVMNLTIVSEREKLAYFSGQSWRNDRVISLNMREAPEDLAARELAVLVLLQRKARVLDSVSRGIRAPRQRLNREDRNCSRSWRAPTPSWLAALSAAQGRRRRTSTGNSSQRSSKGRKGMKPPLVSAARNSALFRSPSLWRP